MNRTELIAKAPSDSEGADIFVSSRLCEYPQWMWLFLCEGYRHWKQLL